jgi:hypothetical protein
MRHLLLPLLLLLAALPVAAQTEVTQLDTLTVELWPDYDRPAMLVILTGTLPESAALPATVTIPLPAGAEVNAVARFNDVDVLVTDVEWTQGEGEMTLTTPARSFHVEYYSAYVSADNEVSYGFAWTADLEVASVAAVVQQPTAATDITIVPAPSGSVTRADGLLYHQIAPRPLAAGEPFTVDVTYTVDAPVLSAPSVSPAATAGPAATVAATEGGLLGDLSPWWLLLIPAALALLVGAWALGRRTGSGRARKPRPNRPARAGATRPAGEGAARFCHQCGQPAQAGDAFCRKCGTRLKQ